MRAAKHHHGAGSAATAVVLGILLTACSLTSQGAARVAETRRSVAPTAEATAGAPPGAVATASPPARPRAQRVVLRPPSDRRRLTLVRTIFGAISPKSVDASGTGRVFAQNMMYRHTITVYASSGRLVRTISDGVRLSAYGVSGHPGISHGAPVEAAVSPDGRYAYVSNYSMYGAGFGPEGHDVCTPESSRAAGVSPSFVYRVDVRRLRIDRVLPVGLVPKFLAVTPDGRDLLVSNWCSYDLSVLSLASGRPVATLPIGPYPRGIAVSPDSRRAYVAVMGGDDVAVVNLRTLAVVGHITVGLSPRHLVISPSGRFLYATLNGAGQVVKVDLRSRAVVARVSTGRDPRSMAMAPDGRALYVVNYLSNTVTVLRAADLMPLQTLPTGRNPVGISYDPVTNCVWVAVYTGEILVFRAR